jgi:hypothetical protein
MSSEITALCERAAAEYLRTLTLTVPSTNIYEGIYNEIALENETTEVIKDLPRIECACQSANQYAWPANNWECELMVVLTVSGDDNTSAEFRTMAGELSDALADTDLPSLLSSSLSGFTCFHVVPGTQGWSVDGRNWQMTTGLTAFCAPADIS